MDTNVDWWARVIGGVGLLLAGLGLALQYRRHRLEHPKLSLKVVVRDPNSDSSPWLLVLTLTNRGGSDVGISSFRIDTTARGFNFAERPTTPLPQGHRVAARNHFTWKMELWPVHPHRETAEYVTTVVPVVGRPLKAKFQTGTYAAVLHPQRPDWVEAKFRDKVAVG